MMTIITLIKPDRFNLRWLEAFKKVSQLILLCCYHETVAPSFLLLPSTIKNNFLMTSGQFEYLWIRSLLNGPLFSLVIRFFKCFSWTWLTFVIRLIRGTIINNLMREEFVPFICSKFAHFPFCFADRFLTLQLQRVIEYICTFWTCTPTFEKDFYRCGASAEGYS